jgi:hypothetical protein
MSDDDNSSTVSVRLQRTLFEGTYTYIASVVTVTWPRPTGGVARATGFAVNNLARWLKPCFANSYRILSEPWMHTVRSNLYCARSERSLVSYLAWR